MNLHQAYLWIGPEAELYKRAVALIQRTLCPTKGCGTCTECCLVVEKQHYSVTWLTPENYYTIKQLEPIFKTVCFTLAAGKHHFIVLERADLLTVTCANSLLKSLEEPPAGYHYLLLSPRAEGILPTIRSRCVVEQSDSYDPTFHRLVQYFTEERCSRPVDLIKEIEKTKVAEHELDQLLDACMYYWNDQYKLSIAEGDHKKAQKSLLVKDILHRYRSKPPMPGSSKLFLKNLFLQLSLAM